MKPPNQPVNINRSPQAIISSFRELLVVLAIYLVVWSVPSRLLLNRANDMVHGMSSNGEAAALSCVRGAL